MSKIVLASGSPRRKELLEQVGLEFEICPAKGEEIISKSIPHEVVVELSEQKAKEVAAAVVAYDEAHADITTPTDIMVIGADTVVAFEDKILGKPKDEEDAKDMLRMLSDKTHSVYTGVTIVFISKEGKTGIHSFYEKTDVSFYPLTDLEIQRYIESGDPLDKAGAYGIQGEFAKHIKGIQGEYNNVVGLPIARLYQELLRLGIDWYLW
ncbi:MAG: Maf family protein [Agathobacter sp.]|nr:Maf family protein [Agathobacter sp.]